MPSPSPQPAAHPAAFPADGLRRLAELILRGDVVFFIGAGFSLDSERNSGTRLISRLLIRLQALSQLLGKDALLIRDALRSTFDLGAIPKEFESAAFPYSKGDLWQLASKYYETNDWFCRAFAELLKIAADIPDAQRPNLAASLLHEEECIRLKPGGDRTEPLDPVSLETGTFLALVRWVDRERVSNPLDDTGPIAAGKSLFLDTMGFRDPRIMAGDPTAESLQRVAESYESRLLPRHHVMARFARDGLCTTTVTPNFDLLLEGAFRLAGFADRTSTACHAFPATHYSEYARITSPTEFFKEGKAHRTAVVVKMHGCAKTYREIILPAQEPRPAEKKLGSYLKSMVFTYREIQNWRDDAWAADYLRTLLRTRTVVFAGYSLQDPVVHDTFRTVYEEMARIRRADRMVAPQSSAAPTLGGIAKPEPGPEAAPAFFFDVIQPSTANKKPFHALEVLNAASDAVGVPRGDFGRHPNFLRFHGRGSPEFPNLDEICRWLFHLVLRFRQKECLANDLQRTLTALHGRARPEVEIRAAQRLFGSLVRRELRTSTAWSKSPIDHPHHALHRRQLSRICSWSESFHVGLLREFAAVDQLRRQGGLGMGLQGLRRLGWYYPMMQDAGWTCWGAIVELALQRMIRRAVAAPRDPGRTLQPRDAERVWAAACELPTALYLRPLHGEATGAAAIGPSLAVLQALSIRFDGFDRTETPAILHGHPTQTCIWLLRDSDAPWRPTRRNRPETQPPGSTASDADPEDERPDLAVFRSRSTLEQRPPPTSVLWRWASRTETPQDRADAPQWLGILRT